MSLETFEGLDKEPIIRDINISDIDEIRIINTVHNKRPIIRIIFKNKSKIDIRNSMFNREHLKQLGIWLK